VKKFLFSLLFSYLNNFLFNPSGRLIQRNLRNVAVHFRGKILDVGAGDKPYRKIFSKVQEYHATNTRRHYQLNHLQPDTDTDFWIEDASCLPFAANTYDGLLCFQVLSVIKEPELFFSEMKRVLKPGSPVLLTTDFLYALWSKEDVMRHTINHLELMAEQNGFEVIERASLGGFLTVQYSLLARFLKHYPSRFTEHGWLLRYFPGYILYSLMLMMVPLISLFGFLAYLMEKSQKDEFTFTPNQMVFLRKRSSNV